MHIVIANYLFLNSHINGYVKMLPDILKFAMYVHTYAYHAEAHFSPLHSKASPKIIIYVNCSTV